MDTTNYAKRHEDLYAALRAQDWAAFAAMFCDYATFQITGTTPVSGIYRGPGAFLDAVGPLLSTTLAPDTAFASRSRVVATGGEITAGLMETEGKGTNGEIYSQRYAHFLQHDVQGITGFIEFNDTALVEAVMFANRLSEPRRIAPQEIYIL